MEHFQKEFLALFSEDIFITMALNEEFVTLYVNNNYVSKDKIMCFNNFIKKKNFRLDEKVFEKLLFVRKNKKNTKFNNFILPDFYNKSIIISNESTITQVATHYILGNNLYGNSIPSTCKKVIYPSKYNAEIIIPTNVTHICLPDDYNRDILLHDNLEYVQFGNQFNKKIILPNNIKILIFGNKYNKSINILPDSLEYIYFGRKFNKEIYNIPENLKFIRFGRDFVMYDILKELNNIKIELEQY